jgi:hypothetical protein
VFWSVELDVPDDGGGRHRNLLEYSLTVEEFLNRYMYVVLGQFVDNNVIDMRSACNVVQFVHSPETGRVNTTWAMLECAGWEC